MNRPKGWKYEQRGDSFIAWLDPNFWLELTGDHELRRKSVKFCCEKSWADLYEQVARVNKENGYEELNG